MTEIDSRSMERWCKVLPFRASVIFQVLFIWLSLSISGCQSNDPPAQQNFLPSIEEASNPASTIVPAASSNAVPTSTITELPTATFPPTQTPIPTETPLPSPTPTPDPYYLYTIDYLTNRDYGNGSIEIIQVLDENSYFTRYFFRFPSDGLDIYGFLNEPEGEGPFPVVIASHGYIDPAVYGTIDYTTRYADALARAGFLVLHPNLRNYPPSDTGENLYRVGMAIDILNLIALVQEGGGDPGPLVNADPKNIGLWGHSMGGGISTRVITVNPQADNGGGPAVKAAVLYGAMSGDEKQNFEAIYRWSEGERGIEELSTPEEVLERISPVFRFDRIEAAVSIHHGRSDELVPLRWSRETCEKLLSLDKEVQCFYYDGMPHTFYGDGDQLFIQRTIDFFNSTLR